MSERDLPAESIRQTPAEVILELEARLNSQRASYAEHAFSIGFRAIAVPILLVIGLAFLLGARGWAAFLIISTSTILFAFVLVSLFANLAQKNAAQRIFREEIEPALAACQEQHQQSLEEFYAAAAAVLPADAILRTFLPLPELETHPNEPPISPIDVP